MRPQTLFPLLFKTEITHVKMFPSKFWQILLLEYWKQSPSGLGEPNLDNARILRVLRRSHPSLISNARVTDKVKSPKYGEVLNINVKSYSCSQNQILRSNNFHLEIELGCSYLNFKEQISKRTCTEFVFVSFIETVISKLGHSKKYHLL